MKRNVEENRRVISFPRLNSALDNTKPSLKKDDSKQSEKYPTFSNLSEACAFFNDKANTKNCHQEATFKILEMICKAVLNGSVNELHRFKTALMSNDFSNMFIESDNCLKKDANEKPKSVCNVDRTALCNALIEAFMRTSQVNTAKKLYKLLVKNEISGAKVSSNTIYCMISGLLHHHLVDEAQKIMNSLPQLGILAGAGIWNAWIGFRLQENQYQHAKDIFNMMVSRKPISRFETFPPPTELTYRLFIQYHLLHGEESAADQIKSKMISAGIKPTSKYYHTILRVLFKIGVSSQIDNVLRDMKDHAITKNASIWNTIISGWMQLGEASLARESLDQMEENENPKPSTLTYNRLLGHAADGLDMAQIQNFLFKMDKNGFKFNGHTYAGIFKALVGQERYNEAIEIIFRLDRPSISSVVPIETVNSLFLLCCQRNFKQGVYVLMDYVKRHNIHPNLHSFAILIKFFLRQRQYRLVSKLLKDMMQRGLRPNIHVLCAQLNHYVEIMDLAKIEEIVGQIHKLQPHSIPQIVYNILMKCFYVHFKYLEGGRLRVVTREFEPKLSNQSLMERLTDIPCDSFNISSLSQDDNKSAHPMSETVSNVTSLSSSPNDLADINPPKDSDNELRLSKRSRFHRASIARLRSSFTEMFPQISFKPCIHTYNEVMSRLLNQLYFEKLFACYEYVLSQGIRPNLLTFTFLIKAHLYVGNTILARERLFEMRRFGLKPTILQAALIFHHHCRKMEAEQAEKLLDEYPRVFGVKQLNYVFYASLIYAYTRRRDYPAVFRVFDRLERNGLVPDTEACNYVLMALLEMNEKSHALSFLEQMRAQRVFRNTYTYSIVVSKLCDGYLEDNRPIKEWLPEILGLLTDSYEPGNSVDSEPYNQIFHSLLNVRQASSSTHDEYFVQVMDHMMTGCIRFDNETLPFLDSIFDYLIAQKTKDSLTKARLLFEKALVDFEAMIEPLDAWFEQLKVSLLSGGLENRETFEKLQKWMNDRDDGLEKVRLKMTQISPDLTAKIMAAGSGAYIPGGSQNIYSLMGDDKMPESIPGTRPLIRYNFDLDRELKIINASMRDDYQEFFTSNN